MITLKTTNLFVTDIEFSFLQLSEGQHYYVTVTACNTAGLCSSATSDGFVVDSTPPIRGILTDGPLETELQYQASRYLVQDNKSYHI